MYRSALRKTDVYILRDKMYFILKELKQVSKINFNSVHTLMSIVLHINHELMVIYTHASKILIIGCMSK